MFYDCTKFHDNQVAGEEVTENQILQILLSDHLKSRYALSPNPEVMVFLAIILRHFTGSNN